METRHAPLMFMAAYDEARDARPALRRVGDMLYLPIYSSKNFSMDANGMMSLRSYRSVWLAPGTTMKSLLFSRPGVTVSFL